MIGNETTLNNSPNDTNITNYIQVTVRSLKNDHTT